MNSYLVTATGKMPALGTHDDVKEFHQETFFDALTALAAGSNGQIDIVNKLLLTGVAIVDATDDGVEMMKKAKFHVEPNGTKRAI